MAKLRFYSEPIPDDVARFHRALVARSGGKSVSLASDGFGFYHTIEHDDPRKAGCDISEYLGRGGYRVILERDVPVAPHVYIVALKPDLGGPISLDDIVQGKATRHVIWVRNPQEA
jgi:hypothetical protein